MLAAARLCSAAVNDLLRGVLAEAAAGGTAEGGATAEGEGEAQAQAREAQLCAMSTMGRTALHVAVEQADLPTVTALLAKADPTANTTAAAAEAAASGTADGTASGTAASDGGPPYTTYGSVGIAPSVAVTLEDYGGKTPLDLGLEQLVLRCVDRGFHIEKHKPSPGLADGFMRRAWPCVLPGLLACSCAAGPCVVLSSAHQSRSARKSACSRQAVCAVLCCAGRTRCAAPSRRATSWLQAGRRWGPSWRRCAAPGRPVPPASEFCVRVLCAHLSLFGTRPCADLGGDDVVCWSAAAHGLPRSPTHVETSLLFHVCWAMWTKRLLRHALTWGFCHPG